MKAFVLAAGLGTRLRPLTFTTPKPLIPLNGQPMVSYTLRHLRYYGITDIYMNLHHLGEQIKQALGDGSAWGVKITYSVEPAILGTGGGMKKLEKSLGADPFLVINSDILTDFPLDQLIDFHAQKKGLASLVLREDPDADRYGPIEIDSEGRIRTILRKGGSFTGKLKKLMFTGIHVVEPALLHAIREGVFHSITDTYIDQLLQNGSLNGLEMQGFWRDLGTLEEYGKMDKLLTEGKIALPYL